MARLVLDGDSLPAGASQPEPRVGRGACSPSRLNDFGGISPSRPITSALHPWPRIDPLGDACATRRLRPASARLHLRSLRRPRRLPRSAPPAPPRDVQATSTCKAGQREPRCDLRRGTGRRAARPRSRPRGARCGRRRRGPPVRSARAFAACARGRRRSPPQGAGRASRSAAWSTATSNFTNVCAKACRFCTFSRTRRSEEGYFLPIEEIVRRALEAQSFGATEICVQAGLAPGIDALLPRPGGRAEGCAAPACTCRHVAERVKFAATGSGMVLPAGARGDERRRPRLAPGHVGRGARRQRARAHRRPGASRPPSGSRSRRRRDHGPRDRPAHHVDASCTATSRRTCERMQHLDLLRSIQRETGGFTEFVPLSFVHEEGADDVLRQQLPELRPGPHGRRRHPPPLRDRTLDAGELPSRTCRSFVGEGRDAPGAVAPRAAPTTSAARSSTRASRRLPERDATDSCRRPRRCGAPSATRGALPSSASTLRRAPHLPPRGGPPTSRPARWRRAISEAVFGAWCRLAARPGAGSSGCRSRRREPLVIGGHVHVEGDALAVDDDRAQTGCPQRCGAVGGKAVGTAEAGRHRRGQGDGERALVW